MVPLDMIESDEDDLDEGGGQLDGYLSVDSAKMPWQLSLLASRDVRDLLNES
jgi:hypothetical protein